MRCFKCGSSDIIRVKIDDGTEIIQCNDCGAKMTIEKNDNEKPVLEEKESMTELKVVAPPKAKTVSPVNQMVKKMQPVLNDVKVWIKNPVSIVSVVINGVLLMLSVVLLVLCCNTGTSAKDEIRDYAVANGYQQADFDKYNSPAEENGLGNSKVYFSGKVKELTKVENYKIALIQDETNTKGVWGVLAFDNNIYSRLKENTKVTVFGYYSGFSNAINAPVVYYANGYINGNWYEYDDILGLFNSLDNTSSKEDSDSVIVDYDDVSSEEESKINDNEGKLGDYYVQIVSARIGKDYKKRNCLIVEYKFTNNSEKTTHFSSVMSYTAFQDGVELDKAYSFDKKYDDNSSTRDIKPGKTLTVYTAYLLNDKKNSVEVEVTESWSFDDDEKVVKTFELSE